MTRAVPVPETVTLQVPFRVAKRGGRKEVTLPEGAPTPRRPVDALVKALVRAFRWKRMLDSGEFANVVDLARHEDIAVSYLTRVLRLTLLAPDMVEAILDGRQGPEVTLARLLGTFPLEWARQVALHASRIANRSAKASRPFGVRSANVGPTELVKTG